MEKDQGMLILYDGEPYLKTETEDEVILTSTEKKHGRYTVLSFTKDEEKSDAIKKNVSNMIKQSIIKNYINSKKHP